MKRIILFIIIAIFLFSVGFGGGILVGRTWLNPESSQTVAVEAPGPLFPVGEFVANLSGAGNHIASFKLSLETSGEKALEMISAASWGARIRNEVILLVKDRVFDELATAEGIMQLAEDIKRTLNAMMPSVHDKAPVVRVLFEGFVLQ